MKPMIRVWLKQQFGDDESLFCELYSQYRMDMEAGMKALREIRASEDGEKLRQKAHALKGIALVVGDQETANVCIALQHAAEARELAQQDALISQLATLVSALSVE